MENQSKGSGRELQRWFESEAETARGYWGGGFEGLSAPSCQDGWEAGPVSFHSLGRAALSALEARSWQVSGLNSAPPRVLIANWEGAGLCFLSCLITRGIAYSSGLY